MANVQEIRKRLRGQRIEILRQSIEPLLARRAGAEVWLFGSLARGDWDARSDVDLLAVAPDQSAADQLAEALLGTGLVDDVIALSLWPPRLRPELQPGCDAQPRRRRGFFVAAERGDSDPALCPPPSVKPPSSDSSCSAAPILPSAAGLSVVVGRGDREP
jgi:predicted nucleotidyltransferase